LVAGESGAKATAVQTLRDCDGDGLWARVGVGSRRKVAATQPESVASACATAAARQGATDSTFRGRTLARQKTNELQRIQVNPTKSRLTSL